MIFRLKIKGRASSVCERGFQMRIIITLAHKEAAKYIVLRKYHAFPVSPPPQQEKGRHREPCIGHCFFYNDKPWAWFFKGTVRPDWICMRVHCEKSFFVLASRQKIPALRTEIPAVDTRTICLLPIEFF